jgi:hypothetical protein
MTERKKYIAKCRAMAIRWADRLPPAEIDWVLHLIDHDEAPEAMCSLAWSISNFDNSVDGSTVAEILALTSDLVPLESFPAPFREASAEGDSAL